MTGKPTPGPWAAEEDPSHYYTLSTVVAGERDEKRFPGVQMVVQVGGFCGPIEQEANAELIAAAGTAAHQLYEAGYDAIEVFKAFPDALRILHRLVSGPYALAGALDFGADTNRALRDGRALLDRLTKKDETDDAGE